MVKNVNASKYVQNPCISVIVAIYNVEKYIKKCLDSIVNQTMQYIEIILVNDGSPDGCAEIIEEYRKKDSRIKVITQKNKGPGAARNRGLDIASGQYILFVDPDDWIESDACEVLYNKAKEINADIVLTGDILYLEEEKMFADGYRDFSKYKDCSEIKEKDFFYTFAAGCERLYKTSFLKQYNIRFNEHHLWEDSSFGALVAMFAKNIGFVKNLYYYRIRKDSTTGTIDYKIFDFIRDFEYFCNYLKEYSVKSKKVKWAYIWYLQNFLMYYRKMLPNFQRMFYAKLVTILPLIDISNIEIYFSKTLPLNKKQEVILFFDFLKMKNYAHKVYRLHIFEKLGIRTVRS